MNLLSLSSLVGLFLVARCRAAEPVDSDGSVLVAAAGAHKGSEVPGSLRASAAAAVEKKRRGKKGREKGGKRGKKGKKGKKGKSGKKGRSAYVSGTARVFFFGCGRIRSQTIAPYTPPPQPPPRRWPTWVTTGSSP